MVKPPKIYPILRDDRFKPCALDHKCLARNIIYFSFIIPLSSEIAYNFAKGCATGQSYFVGIEKHCHCLIWASIPRNTILSGFCLIEVLIDRNKGGNYRGCKHEIEIMFNTLKINCKAKIKYIPYTIETSTSFRNDKFISELKKLFQIERLSDLAYLTNDDFERLREFDIMKLGTEFQDIYNCKLPRHKAYYGKVNDHNCDKTIKKNKYLDKLKKKHNYANAGITMTDIGFKTLDHANIDLSSLETNATSSQEASAASAKLNFSKQKTKSQSKSQDDTHTSKSGGTYDKDNDDDGGAGGGNIVTSGLFENDDENEAGMTGDAGVSKSFKSAKSSSKASRSDNVDKNEFVDIDSVASRYNSFYKSIIIKKDNEITKNDNKSKILKILKSSIGSHKKSKSKILKDNSKYKLSKNKSIKFAASLNSEMIKEFNKAKSIDKQIIYGDNSKIIKQSNEIKSYKALINKTVLPYGETLQYAKTSTSASTFETKLSTSDYYSSIYTQISTQYDEMEPEYVIPFNYKYKKINYNKFEKLEPKVEEPYLFEDETYNIDNDLLIDESESHKLNEQKTFGRTNIKNVKSSNINYSNYLSDILSQYIKEIFL